MRLIVSLTVPQISRAQVRPRLATCIRVSFSWKSSKWGGLCSTCMKVEARCGLYFVLAIESSQWLETFLV